MELNFYGALREVVSQKTIEYFPAQSLTLRELLLKVISRYPGLQTELFDENEELLSHILIVVNGKNVSYLQGILEKPLTSHDRIGVFPAISGGGTLELNRWR